MKRTFLKVFATAIWLAGCAGNAPVFTAVEADLPELRADEARFYFVRTRELQTYFARKAPVWIDGERSGLAAYGSVFYRDVSPGVRRIETQTWDTPGRCWLTLVARAGGTYFVEVAPRNSSAAAFVAGDAAATVAGTSVWTSVASGLAAMAAESKGRDCGGPFRLSLLAKEDAAGKIRDLRFIRNPSDLLDND